MQNINPGTFDRIVQLMRFTQTKGPAGDVRKSYAYDSFVYGSVERSTFDESEDDNFTPGTSLVVTTYTKYGITTDWRAVIGGKTYEIVSIDYGARMSKFMRMSLREV